MNEYLPEGDYKEPRCLLNLHPERFSIPIARIIEKLDHYLDMKDYAACERHLAYWESEALAGNDIRGRLTVLNEQIGLFRKTGQEEKCLDAISQALLLAEGTDIEQTVSYGTTLINAATGLKAFGKAEEALPLYRKAGKIYETELLPDDRRLAGLYNNMALALAELKEYREAESLYHKALDIMNRQKDGEPEAAITYLNMADLVMAEQGAEEGDRMIDGYLTEAERLLDRDSLPRNGYYAFVCEKCAPVFGYYGYFLTEKKLIKRAEEIYERASDSKGVL